MSWLSWRVATIAVFIGLSAGTWYLLDGYDFRLMFASLPALFAAQITASDILETLLISKIGWKTRWFTFLIAPGTILHELCHLFAALATGCTITKAALFKPNPATGVLGFVNYTQPVDKWVVFREFIVGFAPFFGCGLLLLLMGLPYGGGLLGLVDPSPVADQQGYIEFARSVLQTMVDTVSRMNVAKPAVLVAAYLQLCFTMGAAPSTTDFKGAFESLWKHIFSSLFFIAFLALIALVSQKQVTLLGFEDDAAYAVGICLKFTVVVLLSSTALTAALIPVAFLGVKVMEIEGIAKTIPVTGGFLAYYLVNGVWGVWYALTACFLLIIATIIFFTSGKGAKSVARGEDGKKSGK